MPGHLLKSIFFKKGNWTKTALKYAPRNIINIHIILKSCLCQMIMVCINMFCLWIVVIWICYIYISILHCRSSLNFLAAFFDKYTQFEFTVIVKRFYCFSKQCFGVLLISLLSHTLIAFHLSGRNQLLAIGSGII